MKTPQMTKALMLLTVVGLCLAVRAPAEEAQDPTRTIFGKPCDGCELVFVGMPDEIPTVARIAPKDVPGEPLVIVGTVTPLRGGKPVAGVIIYAYQTDSRGIYPDGETRHGSLRAWVRTDEDGNYRFETIRPAAYPDSNVPQHVHLHVIEPGMGTYYISDLVFDDDPLLTVGTRQRYQLGRGGNSVGYPEKDENGVWHVRRDIRLGLNVPGYPGALGRR